MRKFFKKSHIQRCFFSGLKLKSSFGLFWRVNSCIQHYVESLKLNVPLRPRCSKGSGGERGIRNHPGADLEKACGQNRHLQAGVCVCWRPQGGAGGSWQRQHLHPQEPDSRHAVHHHPHLGTRKKEERPSQYYSIYRSVLAMIICQNNDCYSSILCNKCLQVHAFLQIDGHISLGDFI